MFELAPLALADAVALFTRRARAQRMTRRCGEVDDAVQELCRSLDGLPLAIELAAARTKTLSIEEITRRLDDRFNVLSDPTSRRPERRRALKSTIRWSYELLFPDDQRGLWALATFAGGAPLPAVESVLGALEVPAAAAIDVVGRLASRSLVIVDDDGTSMTVRYRLLDSIRAFALEAMTDAGLSDALSPHTPHGSPMPPDRPQRVCAATAKPSTSPSPGPSAPTSTPRWRGAPSHDPLLALSLVNGFGWAWVVLGDSRGAQRILAALDAAGDAAPARDRADALLLAAWIEASTGRLELARDHIAAATEWPTPSTTSTYKRVAATTSPTSCRIDGEFRHALELTDRSDALYEGLDRPWDQAANWLFAARAAISAGDEGRSVDAVDDVQLWLRGRRPVAPRPPGRGARRAGPHPAPVRRCRSSTSAVLRMHRGDSAFGRRRRTSCPASDERSARRATTTPAPATLELAIDKAEATGDVRLAALARVHLGRVLRALGHHGRARTDSTRRRRGTAPPVAENRLRSVNACWPQWTLRIGPRRGDRLAAILDDARRNDDAHVEVFALDALARLAAEAGDIATARGSARR